jgi:uncharacterized membrane protein HdeD (DUF308 family)
VKAALAAILLIVGILGIIAGVLYLTEVAHALPSFFPGHTATGTGKLEKHGYAAIAGGAVLFIIGIVVLASGQRRSRMVSR